MPLDARPRRRALTRLALFGLSAGVALAAPAARGEEATRVGAGIELRAVKVTADHRYEDALGVHVAYRYRVGRVDTDKALFLVAHATVGGRKIRSLVKSANLRDRDGFLHAKKQLVTVPRLSWREDSLFIPYYAMKLTPGRHELELAFEALSDPGSCKTGERPRSLRVVGEQRLAAAITKPPYKMIQLVVQRVEVQKVPTDTALIFSYKRRPDLQWQARFQAGAGGVMHNSATQENVWTGAWSRYSDPFPFSQGDRLTLSILDEDFMGDDLLGRFKLTLDQLLTRDQRPLANAKVQKLVLGPVKAR